MGSWVILWQISGEFYEIIPYYVCMYQSAKFSKTHILKILHLATNWECTKYINASNWKGYKLVSLKKHKYFKPFNMVTLNIKQLSTL